MIGNIYSKVPEKIRCSSCRKDLVLDEIRQDKLSDTRVVLFCKACSSFLGIVDPSTSSFYSKDNSVESKTKEKTTS